MPIQNPTARDVRSSGLGVSESLKRLPMRRLPDPPAVASPVQWTRVDLDRYEVRVGSRTIGFIEVVGAVYVVLEGRRYDRAVEILQTLVFDDALRALDRR